MNPVANRRVKKEEVEFTKHSHGDIDATPTSDSNDKNLYSSVLLRNILTDIKELYLTRSGISKADPVVVLDSGIETKFSYGFMDMELVQRADVLMMWMDFLHLIYFYPVDKEAEVSTRSLVDRASVLNKYIRKSIFPSTRDGNYLMEILRLFKDIEEHLDDAAFDMLPYVTDQKMFGSSESGGRFLEPPLIMEESFWSDIPEICASVVASASIQAIKCIKDLKVKKLGISGSGTEKVLEALKDLQELKHAFDMVLCVRVRLCENITEQLMDDIQEQIRLWKKIYSATRKQTSVLDEFLRCLLFLDCSAIPPDLPEIEPLLSKRFRTVQIVMTRELRINCCQVDLEIRIQEHLLPWNLFSKNAHLATGFVQDAIRLVEKCHGHLLAIILLARALRGVVDTSVWQHASHELASDRDVMSNVLTFILLRMERISQPCIIKFALHNIGPEIEKSSLIKSWILEGLVNSEQQGELVFEDLIDSFFLERVSKSCVRMRDETRASLLSILLLREHHGVRLEQDGSENIEAWYASEIHVVDSRLSKLPNNPIYPILMNLFLHSNQNLMCIPDTFFDNIPRLRTLDLSGTSIKRLPSSISKLTSLQKLIIRDCALLMELPPEIGDLKNLKVFDSEETQLVCLPWQFGGLTRLEYLKCSLYIYADDERPNMQVVPVTDLEKLVRLKEISIFVDAYCKWWEDEVKQVINIFPALWNLESLRLYLPTIELLRVFLEIHNWEGVPIYKDLSDFKFIIGKVEQGLISHIPLDLDKTFVKLPKCLKYTNGEKGDTEVILMMLEFACALSLDRHWTLPSLSAFGAANMENLKYCLLSQCNEMLDVVNEFYLESSSSRQVLGSLEYLSIHFMRSLQCIWKGPIHSASLSNLKTLAIYKCPELRTIFTEGMLDSLSCLENLTLQECTRISSLVSLGTSVHYLPNLKKISLVYLPRLVSIFHGLILAPRLDSLVIYNCTRLERLFYSESSCSYTGNQRRKGMVGEVTVV